MPAKFPEILCWVRCWYLVNTLRGISRNRSSGSSRFRIVRSLLTSLNTLSTPGLPGSDFSSWKERSPPSLLEPPCSSSRNAMRSTSESNLDKDDVGILPSVAWKNCSSYVQIAALISRSMRSGVGGTTFISRNRRYTISTKCSKSWSWNNTFLHGQSITSSASWMVSSRKGVVPA